MLERFDGIWNESNESNQNEVATGQDHADTAGGLDRRKVLQDVAVGSAAVAGAAGSASARKNPVSKPGPGDRDEILSPYDELETAKEAARTHVDKVLPDLAQEGYIENPDVSELGIDRLDRRSRDSDEGIAVKGVRETKDEDFSVLIEARITRGGHTIKFTVNPSAGTAVATVFDSGDLAYRTSTSDVSTESSDCYWYCGTSKNGTWIGYCWWDCHCEWCGAWCGGDYELHHILRCDGIDEDACCPGDSCCPNFDGCKNLDCNYECNCEEECTCSECC